MGISTTLLACLTEQVKNVTTYRKVDDTNLSRAAIMSRNHDYIHGHNNKNSILKLRLPSHNIPKCRLSYLQISDRESFTYF
jgi:hypothetical protein